MEQRLRTDVECQCGLWGVVGMCAEVHTTEAGYCCRELSTVDELAVERHYLVVVVQSFLFCLTCCESLR